MKQVTMLIMLLFWSLHTKAERCPDAYSTMEIRACMSKTVKDFEILLSKYENEVQEMLVSGEAERKKIKNPTYYAPSGTVEAFKKSRKSFANFVDDACNALYKEQIDGTMAPISFLVCKERHYKYRIYRLWNDYLYNKSGIELKRPKFEID